MVVRWRIVFMVAAFGAASACVPDQVQQAERQPVTAAPRPIPAKVASSEPVALDRVVVNIRSGTKIGTHSRCDICAYSDVHWNAGRTPVRASDFAGHFFETMTAAGYRVAGDPNQMFDRDMERASARYLIGGQITDIQFRLKQTNYIFAGLESRGESRVNVNWQVYSLRERRVVFELTTAGTSTLDRGGWDGALAELVLNGFAAAAQDLAFDPGFQNVVASRGTAAEVVTAAVPADAALDLPSYPRLQGPIGSRMPDILAAAVTIFAAGGHGSGFFVSDDGYVLTNNHVVGAAEQVNVRLPSGLELTGRVVRRNAIRDVALLKVDLARVRPLPISTAAPGVGSEVFALGAPRHAEYAGSVTRGIVSALRVERVAGVDLPMIQSDVAIHGGNSGGPLLDASGNVIGIAVSGIGFDKLNSGLNFFIPIDDALRHLNLKLGAARELRF